MKNVTLRRGLALALALVMVVTLAACAPKAPVQEEPPIADAPDTVLAPEAELRITIPSHASWPYDANWSYWRYFKEAVGGKISVNAIVASEYATKVNLMMATPDELPDLLYFTEKSLVNNHASSGAYIAMDDHLDEMPNYTKFLQSLDATVRKELIMQRVSDDGKVYHPPVYGSQAAMNFRTWMYRKDVFEKNGLEVPTDLDELYTVCKKLKELYPDSYPLCFRTGLGQIDIMGPTWANDFHMGTYYDFKEEEWKYGGVTDTMKEIVTFFKKMKDEGLVPPDFQTITTGSWEELISTDRGFIMVDYLVRITYFNVPNQQRNPDYEWAAMAPPAKDATSSHHKIAKVNLDQTGYVVPNTGREEGIKNAIKVLDWMYSDEAVELLSWGKEGETYRVNELGEKEIIVEGDKTAQLLYGVTTYGLYQVIEEAAFNQVIAAGSEIDPVMQTWTENHANPVLYLSLTDEEKEVINMYASAIDTYVQENIAHFIDGTKSLDEWDDYLAGAEDLGIDKMLTVYKQANDRTMNK